MSSASPAAGFRKMQSFVEYNLTLRKNMNSLTLASYILLAVNHGRERNLETEAVLKQSDAQSGAVLRAVDTKVIERQCPRVWVEGFQFGDWCDWRLQNAYQRYSY
jgi:hypothetical protein